MRFRRLELILGILCFGIGLGLVMFDVFDNRKLSDGPDKLMFFPQSSAPSALEIVGIQKKLLSDPDLLIPVRTIEAVVTRPESFVGFLRRHKLSLENAKKVQKALQPYYRYPQLKRGHRFYITLKGDTKESPILQKVVFLMPPAQKVVLILEGGTIQVATKPSILPKKFEYVRGNIQDSLYIDGLKAGLSRAAINSVSKQFSYVIDLQRSLRQGDRFEALIERPFDKETGFIDPGSVVYAALTTSGGEEKIYRFAPQKGEVEYFDEKGRGVRKALLKTPIRGARISSQFGMRKHPIQGYTKMHRGIDFAAPRGTPIFAAGNGYIKKRGYLGSYGNYVLIQHSADYATAYAHLSRFAIGQTRGSRVKQGQVIGYVGTTGRSTAPHLHYEVHYRNKQVNPHKIKMPSQRNLTGTECQNFFTHVRLIHTQIRDLKGTE